MTDETTIESTAAAASVPRPRTRWGAIVWGLIVMAAATITLSTGSSSSRREDFTNWLTHLAAGQIVVGLVLVVGAFVLLLALLSVVKKAQRR